jgi:plasmid stability protein
MNMLCTCEYVLHMKMIQIRNVPESLHRALKERAAREGITLSELILRELPRISGKPTNEEVLARIKTREPVRGLSGAEIIREARGPLDAGR